jgi:hypothetical protein
VWGLIHSEIINSFPGFDTGGKLSGDWFRCR